MGEGSYVVKKLLKTKKVWAVVAVLIGSGLSVAWHGQTSKTVKVEKVTVEETDAIARFQGTWSLALEPTKQYVTENEVVGCGHFDQKPQMINAVYEALKIEVTPTEFRVLNHGKVVSTWSVVSTGSDDTQATILSVLDEKTGEAFDVDLLLVEGKYLNYQHESPLSFNLYLWERANS